MSQKAMRRMFGCSGSLHLLLAAFLSLVDLPSRFVSICAYFKYIDLAVTFMLSELVGVGKIV